MHISYISDSDSVLCMTVPPQSPHASQILEVLSNNSNTNEKNGTGRMWAKELRGKSLGAGSTFFMYSIIPAK